MIYFEKCFFLFDDFHAFFIDFIKYILSGFNFIETIHWNINEFISSEKSNNYNIFKVN